MSFRRRRPLAALLSLGCAGLLLAAPGGAQTQGPADPSLRVVPASRAGKVHILPATLETTQWGWFDNAQAPVLRINSGDTVVMETMMNAHDQLMPGTTIEQILKLRSAHPGRGPHTLTGPIYVEGAEPGDVLKVHINRMVPRAYGTNFNVPGSGQFPSRFPDGQVKYFYLDLDKKIAEFAPGIAIPLRPFPGVLGVARAEPGRFTTVTPGRFGGNLDLRELVEGTSLYVPVFVKGALLWSSDSHAAQGNGEVNLTALETAAKELNITVSVVKDMKLEWPRIETPTHWLTLGYDQDLDKAFELLKAETTKYIAEHRRVGAAEATQIMIRTWDCRIAEVVNGVKGTYCMNPKDPKAAAPGALPLADDATWYVTYAASPDLGAAMDAASYRMLERLQDVRGLTRLDAYALASMTMDCRIGAPAGAEKVVHCLVPKSLWVAKK